MKRCPKCGEHKPAEAFNKSASKKDGLSSHCKACIAAYYAANRDKISQRDKAYRAANRDKISQRDKAYHAANRDKISEQRKAYYAANRDKIIEQNKTYNEQQRARGRRNTNTLRDTYIKQLLTRNTPLRAADIPDWLIDAKRAQLQLKRELHK